MRKAQFFSFVIFMFLLFRGAQATIDTEEQVTNIGAIIDASSRIGKEEKTAMEIAVNEFNTNSKTHKLFLHYGEGGKSPLDSARAAQEMINNEKVKVIVGMERWEEAALVADVGNRAKVPIISLTTRDISSPQLAVRWPFLIRMATDDSDQMKCIADLVRSYSWRKVVVIYENDPIGNGPGELTVLSDALQNIGSEIESRLVLPSDPNEVDQKVKKLLTVQSRVFIVLKSSFPIAIRLFREAKSLGLIGKDTAWVVSETITSFLDSFNASVISSMEGILGIKPYYSEKSSSYNEFNVKFRKSFRSEYPEEDYPQPGIHALRAYDSITTISRALTTGLNETDTNNLLENMLSSNFTGLTGKIRFKSREIFHAPVLRIVNVVGKKYKELDFWLPGLGFSKTVDTTRGGDATKGFSGPVLWPGDMTSEHTPKGWAMPTNATRLKIGVPRRTSFENFVAFDMGDSVPTGFCIDLFYKILENLNYSLPYEFVRHPGSYDELVEGVYNKTYDAAVGDITILAERTKYVDFTQPYAESGLSLIIRAKPDELNWMFMKPFATDMWLGTAFVFVYTMFIVWCLEHRVNPDFKGTWKEQMSAVLWFTFSSLFYAHREKIKSNFSRVVVVTWLFVVFILTASYTASLSSILTVKQLEPNLDINALRTKGLTIGCDNNSFVKDYLVNVFNFSSGKIKTFDTEANYVEQFKTKNISAAFLERPYEKVFIGQNCKDYTSAAYRYKFGGFGFAFQKGSPIAIDVSRAILAISEKGDLKTLEDAWFSPSTACSRYPNNLETNPLSLHSFRHLFLISTAISTLCLLLFIVRLMWSFRRRRQTSPSATARCCGSWTAVVCVETDSPMRIPNVDNLGSSRYEHVDHDTYENPPASPQDVEIEMLQNFEDTKEETKHG